MAAEIDTAALAGAVKRYSRADAKSLYGRLGDYAEQFEVSPQVFEAVDAEIPISGKYAGGVTDELVELGRRITAGWNRALFGLVCRGNEDNAKARSTILDALGTKSPEVLAASLTSVLVSDLHVAPALAVLGGVLLARTLLPATIEALCEYWTDKI
jgi:hypothetical protein